jgi:hypothetical protein
MRDSGFPTGEDGDGVRQCIEQTELCARLKKNDDRRRRSWNHV